MNFKLANIILQVDEHAAAHPELYYCASSDVNVSQVGFSGIEFEGRLGFLTYVNACSVCKWRQYTGLDNLKLNLELEGKGEIIVLGVAPDESSPRELSRLQFDCELRAPFSVSIDVYAVDLVGFAIAPKLGHSVKLYSGCYSTEVDFDRINSVRIALCTTTFKNEKYILPNISLVESGIAAEDCLSADSFHMFVVDNGRTLNVDALSNDLVTVLPNPNTGGSGGFARGILAATEERGKFTHVILMDDDVRIMPESLIRTFNLLSLARGKYKDAFINGAMLSLEDPSRQYEDVSQVLRIGVYRRVKRDFNLGALDDLLENERTSVEVDQAYGAWWYSCVPLKAVEANGLPMPFFIRCDDVEFGMRNKPIYMTMNCICVWHSSFEGRFRPSVDCYQYIRNFFTMIALDECSNERLFVLRTQRAIRQNLRDLDYQAADFILDGIEDYLRGPEYLKSLDGAATMIAKGKLNEKLISVDDIDSETLASAGVTSEVLSDKSTDFQPSRFMKLWRTLPYDKHYLPDFLLGNRVGYVVKNGECRIEGSTTGCKSLIYLDATREKGSVRIIDRARFKEIRKRQHELMARYRKEGEAVRKAWKDAMPYMTSREFWEDYLGLK